jgi:predicted regulator of Ras-like GTPase activity (Roadblock/LC7/MglB family)
VVLSVIAGDGFFLRLLSGTYFDREINEPWFGALLARTPASAEPIGNSIRMNSQELVTIRAPESSILVLVTGEDFLIAAIIKDNADPKCAGSDACGVSR